MTILGIDGTNWVHQLWHAKGGRGVVRAVRERADALIRELSPSAVIACFDRRSFRHDLEPQYKAGRKEKPVQLLADLQAAECELAAVASVAVEEGAEADDGLATLADWARRANERCILASPDKDLRQCLGGPVLLLRSFATEGGRPVRGDWYNAMTLFDKHGLAPNQWVDFQTLVGDHGDAIVGCPGWGKVTAAAALVKCKTLDCMHANPWNVPCSDKQRGALIQFRPRVPLVRQLVTLRTDVAAVWDAMR